MAAGDRNRWLSTLRSLLEEAVENIAIAPFNTFPGAIDARPFGLFGLGLVHLRGVRLSIEGFSAACSSKFLTQAKELGVEQGVEWLDELRKTCAEPGRVGESDVEGVYGNVRVLPNEALRHFFLKCDSKPERLLLDALVRRAALKSAGDHLTGGLLLQVQPKLGKFRVDFLINEDLVVEIDGHAFHGDKRAFEVDRLRDQELILRGLRVIRFPAKQVFLNPDDVADIVIAAATRKR
jgi:very-short-patch-repair endonuclease